MILSMKAVFTEWGLNRQISIIPQLKWYRGVRLDFVEFKKYVPPAIPPEALEYNPLVKPPPEHPRLWVNEQTLPIIESRLKAPENKGVWQKVVLAATEPFKFDFNPDSEMNFNADLEEAAKLKSFY